MQQQIDFSGRTNSMFVFKYFIPRDEYPSPKYDLIGSSSQKFQVVNTDHLKPIVWIRFISEQFWACISAKESLTYTSTF